MSLYKRKRSPASASAFVLGPYRAPRPVKRRRAMVPAAARYPSGELKFHDITLDDAIVASGAGVRDSFNKIAQGITESERVGRKCTIKSVWWKYQCALPEFDAQGTPDNSDQVRVILYIDKQCNGATATITDLLESSTIHSFRNLANQGRFIFLMDRVHALNYKNLASDGAGVVSGARVAEEFSFYKKLNLPIEFNGATGAIDEIRSNNIGGALVSRNSDAGFLSNLRLRFTDS